MIGENGYGGAGRLPWRIDSTGHLYGRVVSEDEGVEATTIGYGWNINTKNISITAETGLLYLKNNNAKTFVIKTFIVGTGDATTSDIGELTLINNPTAGTLISTATNVTIAQNRNTSAGSGFLPSANMDIYQGASGATVTDGDEAAFFYHGNGSAGRSSFPVDWEVTNGGSIAIKYDPKLSSGSVKCYMAVIGFLKTIES